MASECPTKYFVAATTEMSQPAAKASKKRPAAQVLSIATSAPAVRAASTIAGTSDTSMVREQGDSR